MTARSVTHATFVIQRTFDASPARVFAAFASRDAKIRWFSGPDDEAWQHSGLELDFRVGGRERISGRLPGDTVHTYEALYHDIVDNERIVSTYEMYQDDVRTSVSVATTELRPAGMGTTLVYTEQGAFLDGYDNAADREHGTRELFDALDASLHRADVDA